MLAAQFLVQHHLLSTPHSPPTPPLFLHLDNSVIALHHTPRGRAVHLLHELQPQHLVHHRHRRVPVDRELRSGQRRERSARDHAGRGVEAEEGGKSRRDGEQVVVRLRARNQLDFGQNVHAQLRDLRVVVEERNRARLWND